MEVYEALRKLLDSHPAGCPPAPEIIGILKLLFTEEEAKVALGLGFSPFSVEQIARRARTDPDETLRHLESLANKGIVFSSEKNGVMRYGIYPTMPGLFEFPFMKAEPGEDLDRLSALWKGYMPTLSQCMGSPAMPISRIITVEETIPHEAGVLTFEKIDQMIDNARSVGIGKCACRVYGQNCDAPIEACMVFDNICDHLTSRGLARRITKEEMKQLLRKFEEKGLVHQVNNAQDRIDFICNCCPCCCALLKCLNTYGNPHAVNDSGFVPQIDPEACTVCGICRDERCPMDAIAITDSGVTVNLKKCIGCGLCATGCPESAVTLVRREDWRTPPPKTRDIGLTILTERGKTEEILPYTNPDIDPPGMEKK